jgi:phosphoribosylanthranilate isomerase
MTKIKICGLKNIEDALESANYGADFLGIVFVPSSKRCLDPKDARNLIEGFKKSWANETHPKWVGVFQDQEIKDVNNILYDCNLDIAQLSGIETTNYCNDIVRPVFKVTHISNEYASDDQLYTAKSKVSIIESNGHTPMLDTSLDGIKGGTGVIFDWDIAEELAKSHQLLIAGGLTPDNVSAAIYKIKPWGVDVSSGVEKNGEKDRLMISRFINNVKIMDKSKS